jgi:threonyl-tRNA synthetase
VEKEALGHETPPSAQPKYIDVLKRLGVDWEEMSDAGHMRFGPEGTFIFDLICDYANQIVRTLGLPVYNVRGTNLFSMDSRPIKEHASLFGQRMYNVEADERRYVMRYAACFQQFALTKHWTISHRHFPFGEFEIADSYRMEQSGELQLGFRLRRLNMPDLHIFCRDMSEAMAVLRKVHERIYEETEKLGRTYYSLYNLTSRAFFEENRSFFLELLKREGKPVLLAFYPENADYYWVLNIEYHIIDLAGRPREIGTVQIDTGNAKRFGIEYIDPEGRQRNPVILHTAIIGSIERWLYAIVDSSLSSKHPPELPLWLSPTQIRLILVSEKYVEHALQIAGKLNSLGVRADVDDRSSTVGKKVREAETSWIPYSALIGEKEISNSSKGLSVRARSSKSVSLLSIEEAARKIREDTKGYPYPPLAVPVLVSTRPIYSN